MRSFLGFLAVLVLTTLTAHAAGESTWNADPVHSSANFTATHLGISHVNGIIPILSASVVVPDGTNIPTSARASLDPSGVDTRNSHRDDDLRSAHFFDVATYPKMGFVSTKFVATDATHFTATGDFSLHGQTHPVTLTCEYLGRGPGMRPTEQRIAYTCKTTIDRTQWGMNLFFPVVSNNIDLEIDIEAIKQ
ncbi:MAG TPA: YceI family protein [Candidatus Acidoferrum sp.]|jgi:polyisoprenoid-binding protein YceI|nr:YceI family protein [Candidatus Acidoferrum sp.]